MLCTLKEVLFSFLYFVLLNTFCALSYMMFYVHIGSSEEIESYNRYIQLTKRNLQLRNVRIEMFGNTNCIITSIGYTTIMLRKTHQGREIEFYTILFDKNLIFLLMK